MPVAFQRNGAALTITLSGQNVYGAAHRALKEETLHAIETGVKHITIRVHGVEFMDSDVLGMLVSIRKRARDGGGAVVIEGLASGLHTLFDYVHLSHLFTLVDCEPSEFHRSLAGARVDGRSAR